MDEIKSDHDIIKRIGAILLASTRPMKERFRALFTLRNIGGDLSISCIEDCFDDPSALLKHECAYCLGQMQDEIAVPKLESVLDDPNQEAIVRHEAAEALGAIGKKSSLNVLKKHLHDSSPEVAETCELSIRKITESTHNLECYLNSPYKSIDPAPPLNTIPTIATLESLLLNDNLPLYDRYQALFTLRNIGTTESAMILAKGLQHGSALFRHEIAYVLGQMQDAATVEMLSEVLCNERENAMVRHECAEALGSIATDECMQVLQKYLSDSKQVVRESCEVALDMFDYENSKEFQYANALMRLCKC